MELELQKTSNKTAKQPKRHPKALKNLPTVDIYCIGAVGFSRHLKQPGTTAFVTSIYEIDRVIEEKEIKAIRKETKQQELTNKELIDKKLLA